MPSLPIVYRIYRDGNPVPVGSTTQLEFTDIPLLADSSHTYEVDAVDSAGNASPKSSPSGFISVVPSGDTTPPTVPGKPAGAATGPSTVTISWPASSDASPPITYRIYRDGGSVPIASTSATTYNDFGLAPSSSHTYRVDAVDAALNVSAKSTASDAIVTDAPSVTPPTPTLRGFIEDAAMSNSHLLTPTSTPVGEVMLHCVLTNSSSVATDLVASGGGASPGDVTWRTMRPYGNDVQATSSRKMFMIWGHGTFNGSDITLTIGGATVDWEVHLIDWANTKTSRPFIKLWYTPLPSGNHSDIDMYQQRRVGSNNAIAGLVFDGVANQTHVLKDGGSTGTDITSTNVLRHTAQAGLVCTTTSFWKASSFTNFKLNTSGFTASSTGALSYEIQATDSDDGPNCNTRRILDFHDLSGNVVSSAIFPKPNEVVVFACISERPGSTVGFTGVADSSGNTYDEVFRINLDADHVFQIWAHRYNASPPSAPTITGTWASPSPVIGSTGTIQGVFKEDGTGPPGTTNLDWFRQIVSNTVSAATAIAVTLPSMLQHGGVMGFFGRNSSAQDWIFEQGWVYSGNRPDDGVSFGHGSKTQCIFSVYNGGDEDNTLSASVVAAGNLAVIGIETL